MVSLLRSPTCIAVRNRVQALGRVRGVAPGLTEGATEHTKGRYAFVYGDFRRLHRMGLIACHYRAAEWGTRTVEWRAHELSSIWTTRRNLVSFLPGNSDRPRVSHIVSIVRMIFISLPFFGRDWAFWAPTWSPIGLGYGLARSPAPTQSEKL